MNPILDTGHGTSIDVQTLNGVIHDEAAFAVWAGQGVDPVLHVIGPLFRGDLDAAQAALDRLSVAADPKVQFRLHALGADILRDRGQFAEAVHHTSCCSFNTPVRAAKQCSGSTLERCTSPLGTSGQRGMTLPLH